MPEYLGREETITQNSAVQQKIVSLQKATADKLRIKLQVCSHRIWGALTIKDRNKGLDSEFPRANPVYAGAREGGQVWNSSHTVASFKKPCTAQARNLSSANSSNRMRQRLFLQASQQVPASFMCGGKSQHSSTARTGQFVYL